MVGVPTKRFLASGIGLSLRSSASEPHRLGTAGAGRPSIYMPPRGAAHNARPVKSKSTSTTTGRRGFGVETGQTRSTCLLGQPVDRE